MKKVSVERAKAGNDAKLDPCLVGMCRTSLDLSAKATGYPLDIHAVRSELTEHSFYLDVATSMMISSLDERSARSSFDFVQSSILEALVPANEHVDVESLFAGWISNGNDNEDSLLPFIEQRHFLLLDELVPVFVVLRTSKSDIESLNKFLSRLSITVDAVATGLLVASTSGQQSGDTSPHPVQAKDLLHSQALDQVDRPLILDHHTVSATGNDFVYLFWKTSIFIGRPKTRLQKLGVYFAVSATLQQALQSEIAPSDDDYLPSGVPTVLNLLESVTGDTKLQGGTPHLPISRIMRTAPSSPALRDISARPIRSAPRRIFRAGPALSWRIRFNRTATSEQYPTLLATLELEATPFASCDVEVDGVDIILADGHAIPLTSDAYPCFPAICKPGDQFLFVCKLMLGLAWEQSSDHIYGLDINILGNALIAEDCRPRIEIKWQTNIDLTPAAPPLRPGTSDMESRSADEPRTSLQSVIPGQDLGVSLTISGPPQVYVGEVFQWSVFMVNRSATARKFAILIIPKRSSARPTHLQKPSIGSANGAVQEESANPVEAVLNEHAVHEELLKGAVESAELVSLSPDVRIGPLGISSVLD